MTRNDVVVALRAALKRYPTQYEAAAALHVAPQYISDVLRGRREPGPKMLKALGIERSVVYAKVRS